METLNGTKMRVHIRWMIHGDMKKVVKIEKEAFEYPWFEEDFIKCLRQRNCIGMVAESQERVVGYMIYELYKTKLKVTNFAVDPDFHWRGIGTQMIQKLISKLSSERRVKICTSVRETNLTAQLFFKKMNFKCTKIDKKFYDENEEDSYYFVYDIEDQDEPIHTERNS